MKEKLLLLAYGAFISLMTIHIGAEREKIEPLIASKEPASTEIVELTRETTEETTEKAYIPIEIPMEAELQEWIYTYCNERNISPAIVIAVIEKESNYNSNAIGDKCNSYGLMQIYKKFHTDRMEKLGVTDLLDAKQNVKVGVDYLLELFNESPEPAWALNAYNGGRAYANRKAAAGEDTEYSVDILDRAEVLERMWEYAGN